MSGLPAWADPELSAKLEALAAGGESQDIELKARLPEQMRDIAREIAAFATTNAGTILIGVDDEGVIVGIENGLDAAERDAFRSRIEGICTSAVKPLVTPKLRFGLVRDTVVAAIDVAKGTAPIYYASSVPYLRQLTSARAMTPDEVIEHVLAWNEDRRGTNTLQVFIKNLDTVLVGADLALQAFRTGLGEARASAQFSLSVFSEQARALRPLRLRTRRSLFPSSRRWQTISLGWPPSSPLLAGRAWRPNP